MKKVSDIMIRKLITVDCEDNVCAVAKKMDECNIGSVVVTQNAKPVGIVTERDLITRCLSKCADPTRIKALDIMSKPLICCGPDTTIQEAAKLMISNLIRRLLVCDGNDILGIITSSDLMNTVAKPAKKEETLLYLASDYEVF